MDVIEDGKRLGQYRIVKKIGSGSMGGVFEAEHVGLRVHRALKTFAPQCGGDEESLRRRFCAEARALCELSKDAPLQLSKVYDLVESDRQAYYVMDLILCADGQSRNLKTVQDEGYEAFTPENLRVWFRDICIALDYLHGKRFIHRDVKPSNIQLNAQGHAVLVDFGTIKSTDANQAQRLGMEVSYCDAFSRDQLGTKQYWAPELWEGREATQASDCFALGVTFWKLVRDEDFRPSMDVLAGWDGVDEADFWRSVLPELLNPCPEKRMSLKACLGVCDQYCAKEVSENTHAAKRHGLRPKKRQRTLPHERTAPGDKQAGEANEKKGDPWYVNAGLVILLLTFAAGSLWLDWCYTSLIWKLSIWNGGWFWTALSWPIRILIVSGLVWFAVKKLCDCLETWVWWVLGIQFVVWLLIR